MTSLPPILSADRHRNKGFVSMLPAGALWVASMLGLLMSAFAAVAQDPPSRVGRLSDLGGSVFLAPDDSETGWQPVGVNYPVTIGDNIWVSQDGRAEIDFGAGQIRLANEANVHFTQLDDRQFSAFLANGRANLRLRAIEPGETAKLDTPNAQIDILRPGSYRLDTSADASHTTLIVHEGEAEVRVGDRATRVSAGQTAAVEGNGYGAAMMVREGYGTDAFDAYASERDRRIEAAGQSTQYVSSYVPGVSDLDTYGSWETAPTYGAVWYPRAVAADWVPYQDGQWTYVQPWGWTWVDNAPWGWAPFHYGRWVRVGPRWAWSPGEYSRRPVWSPALVAWYGGPSGTSWSSGFSGPTFGWVPLSWGEPYWPHYRHSAEYWRRTNQPMAIDVRRFSERPPQRYNYANARVPGAVTAAPAEVLTNRRPVGPNHYTVPMQQVANAQFTSMPLSVRPTVRPLTIDKMPARAPMPAGSIAGRGRSDYSSPSIMQGQPSGSAAVVGRPLEPAAGFGRGGNSGTPFTGQQPSALVPQQGGIRPLPSGSPMPSSVQQPQSLVSQQGGIRPLPGVTQGPAVIDSRAVGGQMYMPTNRPQPGPRQPGFEPVPLPAQQQPPPMRQRPYPGVVRDGAPIAAPQSLPQAAPPQTYIPPPQMRPQMRAPAPMPAAPAPQSIAPAQGSIAPAPVSARQGSQHPQQGGRPGEVPVAPGPGPLPPPR